MESTDRTCGEFGARLAAERVRRRLGSQEEFGALLGMWSGHLGQKRGPVPGETVCRWEKGHRWPGKWHAYCICHMLGLSPGQTVWVLVKAMSLHGHAFALAPPPT